jgi:hypothetical protein
MLFRLTQEYEVKLDQDDVWKLRDLKVEGIENVLGSCLEAAMCEVQIGNQSGTVVLARDGYWYNSKELVEDADEIISVYYEAYEGELTWIHIS